MRLLLSTSFWILFISISFGQFQIDVEYLGAQGEHNLDNQISYKPTESPDEAIKKYITRLRSRGYLLANLDEMVCEEESCDAVIYLGEIHRWMSINFESVPMSYLKKAKIKPKSYSEKLVNLEQFQNDLRSIQKVAADDGYPNSEILSDSLRIVDGWVDLKVGFLSGNRYSYDSLVTNDQVVKPQFLAALLSVSEGKQYRQTDVDRIPQKINQSGYLSMDTVPRVSLNDGLATLDIQVEKIKANKIDAIIGILPNGTSGVTISGYADLNLKNLFKSGKELGFLWRQYDQQSQLIDLKYAHPNILKSPLGIEAGFYLLKQDTSFTDRRFRFKTFAQAGFVNFDFEVELNSSRLINGESNVGQNVRNFDLQYYGIGLEYWKMDDYYNPMSGFSLGIRGSLGNKQVSKTISGSDSLSGNSIQTKLSGTAQINFGLGGPFVFHVNLNGGLVGNNQALFINDLFRIGGLKSLRGFDELQFYARSYLVSTIEMRLLVGQSSRLFAFFDQGFINDLTNQSDNPLGFGLGMMLGTKSGSFQLIYALGNSKEQSLSLSQGKVHLGYVAQF